MLIIFGPGVIIILAAALRTSAHQGKTRRAVLCRDTAHIKGVWKFDLGRSGLLCRPLYAVSFC